MLNIYFTDYFSAMSTQTRFSVHKTHMVEIDNSFLVFFLSLSIFFLPSPPFTVPFIEYISFNVSFFGFLFTIERNKRIVKMELQKKKEKRTNKLRSGKRKCEGE